MFAHCGGPENPYQKTREIMGINFTEVFESKNLIIMENTQKMRPF